jgi:acetoin utilization protein AcuB
VIARELISQSLPNIHTSDKGDEVMNMMQIYHVRHLPIVNHEQLLGVISEEDILIQNTSEAIGTYRLSYVRPYCYETDHIFEVIAKLGRFQLTIIPIIDKEENYLGAITMEDVLQYFAQRFSFAEQGSIIVLEALKGDYSISEVARIAESEDVSILSCFVHADVDTSKVLITLKVNKQEIQTIKATYERYGYQIAATFAEIDQFDGLKERYDSLMTYLNV